LDLPQTLKILAKLPKLKSLHLDNDGLVQLPQELYALKQLESLYLNNNKLPEIPRQLEGLPHLQYLEMRNNTLQPDVIDTRNLNFGFKIQL
jgi:Leucine-rich repeat (LRR) protein